MDVWGEGQVSGTAWKGVYDGWAAGNAAGSGDEVQRGRVCILAVQSLRCYIVKVRGNSWDGDEEGGAA